MPTPAFAAAVAKSTRAALSGGLRERNRRRPTLPGGCPPSTIGPGELNFSVRNGKRCFPAGMTAELSKERGKSSRLPSKLHSDPTPMFKSRPRAISTARLNTLLCLHRPPIKVVVSDRPYSLEGDGSSHLEVGFPLRCFQRLSHPDVANQQRRWHDD